MNQTKITDYFSSNQQLIENTINQSIYNIQKKIDCYLDFEEIHNNILYNLSPEKVKQFTKLNMINYKINSKYSDAEDFIKLYQQKYKVTIDRKTFYNFFEELVKQNTKGMINHCFECGVDMGECNPRQLCGKWRCDFN